MVIAANKSIIVQKGADSQPEEHLFSLRKRIEKILSGGKIEQEKSEGDPWLQMKEYLLHVMGAYPWRGN